MSITESSSYYDNLEDMPVRALLENINREDKTVPNAVEKVIPQIEKLVNKVVEHMKKGGRLFYIGAGTSGRLGILDASECPPTYGVSDELVIGLIAGGDGAIRKAVEFAEDDTTRGWKDLQKYKITKEDVLVGIAASGKTPYVVGALDEAKRHGISTACITCNPDTLLAEKSDIPIEVIVGPEFVTGSSRMKAGTAQKLILNMLSTAVMVRLGKVKGNQMVHMQLSNNKLINRGINMLIETLGINAEEAKSLLREYGSVNRVLKVYGKS